MKKNPFLGENLEDLHEKEDRRSAPNTQLNPVLGENFEDLHFSSADAEELEFQRSAPHPMLESPVLDENLEDLRHLTPEPEELECQWSARQSAAKKSRI